MAKDGNLDQSASLTAANDTGAPSINAPDIDPKTLRAQVRAISNSEQAYRLVDAMFNPDTERNRINGVIAEKFNDAPPFDQKKLRDSGESWRHNFPTGFMSGIINQVVTSPVDIIDAAQYLTAASLDEKDDPDGSKTEAFRKGLTTLLRSWSGWRTHCYALSQEDTTYGYAVACCLDPDEWRPRFFRQDEFGVPDGTEQHADSVQLLGLKQSFLIDEIMELITDKESAELAGWDIKETVDAINKAMPEKKVDGKITTRDHADLIREGNSGLSHDPQARTVDVYHLFAREADGKVSHYILNRNEGHKLLYDAPDEFESMSDILTLYSLEPGNGKLYGSKGLGRKLINIHMAIERARNRAADQMYLSSMIWMKSEKGLPNVQFKVRHPFGIIGSDADIEAEAMPANIEPFLKLDERLSSFAESAAGSYIPNKLGEQSPRRTAHEVVIEDQRESQTRQAYLKRFFGQFSDEITMITRRVCKPDTKDKKAKQFQKDMEEAGLTKELLAKLAAMPATEVVHDLAQVKDQNVAQMCAELRGNPFADQFKVTRREVIARVSTGFADDVLYKDGIDPTNEIEQTRQQLIENDGMRVGGTYPVSPRDNHKVHSNVIIGDLKQSAPNIEKQLEEQTLNPAILDTVNAALRHGETHVGQWEAIATATKNQDDLAEIEKHKAFYAEAEQLLVSAGEKMKRQQAAAAQEAEQPPPAPPPAQTGTPPPQKGTQEHLVKLSETIPYDKAPSPNSTSTRSPVRA